MTIDHKEKMDKADKFYSFITLKKCFVALSEYKSESQRLKYI